MSQFQLPGGTRLWAEGTDNEKIAIHLGKEVIFEQTGTAEMGDIQFDKQGALEVKIDRKSVV